MGDIRVLGDSLINRIAAGEVVERPASVVKELVENSIDAGARQVAVRLEAGGRQSIEVTDNGCGMDRDDALLAVERHATSKVSVPEDLERIRTLGFRGEALASIAAVSVFRLATAREDGQGTELVIRGGRVESVREAALPRGTSIRVERLFFNQPARRKFLRSDATELTHAVRWMTRYGLAHPAVGLRADQGARTLLRVSPAEDRRTRIAEVFGADLLDKLLAFDEQWPGLRVHGLAGRPVDALPRRDGQYLFVNGRAVQDRLLGHAIQQAYGNTMPRGRFPQAFVYLEVDPDRVDVNVHPQKTEVRFRDPGGVHDRLREAVASALSRPGVVPSYGDLRPLAPTSGEIGEPQPRWRDDEGGSAAPFPRQAPTEASRVTAARPIAVPASEDPAPRTLLDPEPEETPRQPRAQALAQYRDSYILAQDGQGLVLVDQHAAHERVLFERFLAAAAENRVEIQRLLFPVTVELGPHELLTLEEELEEFRRLGFDLEPFGGQTVRIDAVPALLGELDPAATLRELLGEAGTCRAAAADVERLRHGLVTSAACQAAIKINHPLTRTTMQSLLDDLGKTVSPGTCPHGRPVWFRLTLDEIERAFGRR